MSDVRVYLTFGPEAEDPLAVAQELEQLDSVVSAEGEVEEQERAGEIAAQLTEVTVTLTAAGGTVVALNSLLDQLKSAVGKWHALRGAMVRTPAGPKPLEAVTAEELAE